MGRATLRTKEKDERIVEEPTMDRASAIQSLKTSVSQVFMEAQQPNAMLRIHSIRLREIQLNCCLKSPRLAGSQEDIDEEGQQAFISEVFRNINKVLSIKKKGSYADRIVRFMAGFLAYIQGKDEDAKKKALELTQKEMDTAAATTAEETNKSESKDDETQEEENQDTATASPTTDARDTDSDSPLFLQAVVIESQEPVFEGEEEIIEDVEFETISSKFIERLLRHLLRGFAAKNGAVRLRCCQIVALSMSSMGEIDEDLYQDLKAALFERIIDKEASIRVQAATALCRLQGADQDEDPTDHKTITQKLIWSLQHDPSAELRRVILLNIDARPDTISCIVEKARDIDPVNRSVVYLKPLFSLPDFRLFDSVERNQVLKWGLNDRNPQVRKAVEKMLSGSWIKQANNNLIELLERLEIMKLGGCEVAEKVLTAFFSQHMEIIKDIKFDVEFWANLTPESAFLARVLIKFLQEDIEMSDKLDTILPEVTAHAVNIEYYNSIYRSGSEETSADYEFITTQMLDTALCLDYADEVGRRKMFETLREILRSFELIDDHLSKIIRIFRIISLDERDFTRTLIEIISDIQEQVNPFEDLEESSPAKRPRTDYSPPLMDDEPVIDLSSAQNEPTSQAIIDALVSKLRCLHICRFMLENAQETLAENNNLYGLLNDLVVPAVQHNDPVLREEGLHCLGLLCTLDKTLAQHNFTMFIKCVTNGQEETAIKSLKIMFDLMMTYGAEAMSELLESPDEINEVFEFCLDHDNGEVQALTTEGLAKLMLYKRMLSKRSQSDEILRLLILLYFFPTVAGGSNNKIQQCLTYFFPAYCLSSIDHQMSLSRIAIPVLEELCKINTELESDEIMISPTQIAEMITDWVDPRKLPKDHIPNYAAEDKPEGSNIPGQLAIGALKGIHQQDSGIQRKTLCHFVLKLYLDQVESTHLIEIRQLLEAIEKDNPLKEAHLRNSFKKLSKTIDELLEECGSQFLIPEENSSVRENIVSDPPAATSSAHDGHNAVEKENTGPKKRKSNKRARVETDDEEDEAPVDTEENQNKAETDENEKDGHGFGTEEETSEKEQEEKSADEEEEEENNEQDSGEEQSSSDEQDDESDEDYNHS